ncbi:hypothetical protein T4B_5523 [Trichinella pseudospiralis]|uniref:Uncharacterized protein n=1 Tax=Trichinella pseudospiralis TaxID=6337 RepID=A0A0V1IYG6_TRIPS|nr:hypothetical protein T4B_5523 [Trichinella pseudospiralis]KRZ33055.1 hypothetical protein T4C_10603 [Trichinella pseudospiralis]
MQYMQLISIICKWVTNLQVARAETFKRVNAVRRAKAFLSLLCNSCSHNGQAWIKSRRVPLYCFLHFIQFAVLSDQGQSCQEACMTRHSTCDLMDLNRRNEEQMIDILKRELEIKCMMDDRTWWSFDQPSVVVDPLDKNFGRCLGWKGKPKYHDCSARWPTVRRVCLCSKTFSCLAKKWIR